MDCWSLGVILYIMLVGLHPFDINSNLTDEEIEVHIKEQRTPPLHGSPHTAHLSPSAIDLLSKLMSDDPRKRLSAHEMLDHPWVKGETARRDVIEGLDEKLSKLRRFQSKVEAKVFHKIVETNVLTNVCVVRGVFDHHIFEGRRKHEREQFHVVRGDELRSRRVDS